MAEKILIVDDDPDTLRLVGLMLERQGYQITAANNGELGLAQALEVIPDLILLDLMMPGMDGYEVTRRLRSNAATQSIPILMFTAKTQLDDKVVGFEAGADDYLTKPTHPSELQAHVRTLLARSSISVSAASALPQEQHGYIIGVISARGGLGVSSVAVNLAAALHSRSQADVILAELVPGQGTLGADLGLSDGKLLNEMLSGPVLEITREKIQSSLLVHSSGIKFLPASENPRDIQLTSKAQNYEMLVTRLSSMAKFVVLDMGTSLPPFAIKSLAICNEIAVVVEGAPNPIRHTKILIEQMMASGIEPGKVFAVLNNRARAESQMPWATVQEQLGHPIAVTITPAPELFAQAVRMQTPAVICQPDNSASQQLLKLADLILEREHAR
jgi:pilus assembly protein CpaE